MVGALAELAVGVGPVGHGLLQVGHVELEMVRDLARGEWGNLMTGDRVSLSSIIEIGSDRDVTDEFKAAALLQMEPA